MRFIATLFFSLTFVALCPLVAQEARVARQPKSARAELSSEQTPPGKVYVYKHSAGKPRELEIYFPPNHDPHKLEAKVPGLILFHGGGWSGGSLIQFRTACQYFASRGVVAVTANYQMLSGAEAKQLQTGESRKRACITDAKSAIRWFKQHADALGVDPERIITGGGSAGGHVSVLATMNDGLNDPADPKDFDTSVVAYVLFNPAFALDDNQDSEVDVLKHIRPTMAPAIAFFGSTDHWKEGWDNLQQELKRQGNTTTELQIAEGQKHSFFNKDPWRSVTLIAADRFLIKLGLLKGEPTLATPATGQTLVAAPR